MHEVKQIVDKCEQCKKPRRIVVEGVKPSGDKTRLIDQLYSMLIETNVKIISIQVGGDFIACGMDGHDPLKVYQVFDAMREGISENTVLSRKQPRIAFLAA